MTSSPSRAGQETPAAREHMNSNLPRRKEQLVIAKLVDALGMTPSDLQQAVTKLKRYKIVKR